MTTDRPSAADEPFDQDTFETELAELIDHACECAVDIRGGYDVCVPRPTQPNYTVEITEITKSEYTVANR